MPDMICLYYGDPTECQNCGGWVGCAGIDGGIVTDFGRFFSTDRVDDAIEFQARAKAQLEASRHQ